MGKQSVQIKRKCTCVVTNPNFKKMSKCYSISMNGSCCIMDEKELASKTVSDMGKQAVQIGRKFTLGVSILISIIPNSNPEII